MRKILHTLRKAAKRGISNKTYLLLLIFIGIATHVLWFRPGTVLFHQDWLHSTDEATRQAWEAQGSWKNLSGLGGPNIQLGFYIVTALWPLITMVGGSFDAAAKVTVMIPIAILGFVAPYMMIRKLFADNFVAFVTALFYGSTTYFLLRQRAHLPIAFVYALAPLIFTFLVEALRSRKIRDWLLFTLAYTVGLCYEVRIMYLITSILLLYIVMFYLDVPTVKKLIKPALIAVLIMIGLNSFWLLPTMLGGIGSSITQTTSRLLFGNSLFDLPHALTLSPASWTGGAPDENFVMQPIKLYLWSIPFLIIFLLIKFKDRLSTFRRKEALFFLIIALVGIFLTKQVLEPLPQAYPWLYTHFPGFSLFREGSKFYQFTAWGYMGLLAIGLISLRKAVHPITFRVVACIPIAVACLNLSPLVTGKFRTLFVTRHIPNDYTLINKKIAASPEGSRTLWLPSESKWAYFDQTHPKTSAVSLIQQEWKSFVKSNDAPTRQQLQEFFRAPFANKILDAASMRFVIVPLRDIANEDDFIKYYGDDRQFYIDLLDTTPWLKKLDLGTNEAVVYENQDVAPLITSSANLYTANSQADIDELYKLNEQALRKDFSFTIEDKDNPQTKKGSVLGSVFSNPNELEVKKESIALQFNLKSNKPLLYSNDNSPSATYRVSKNIFELSVTQNARLRLNGKDIESQNSAVDKRVSAPLDPTRQYYLAAGQKITPINSEGEDRNLGKIQDPVRLLSTSKDNLIVNAAFQNGPWKKKVEDCSPYDKNADIEMDIVQFDQADAQKSLVLYAAKHAACTGPDAVSVEAGKEYLLSFDYRVEDGDEAGYRVTFNDPKHTVVQRYTHLKDKTWRTVHQSFVVPEGATKATIKLLGIPNTQVPTATYYKNIGLRQLTTALQPALDLIPAYSALALKNGKNTFEYFDPTYTGKNLFPNPSLEKGLWQKQVGDCNAHDSYARLKMQNADIASDGKKSLELAAQRHIACTGPESIPIKENATYLLSFDHQSPNVKSANYYISFDSPERGDASLEADVPTTPKWQRHSRIIKTPMGVRSLQLSVRARSGGSSEHSINRYDNFKLIEVPDIQNQYFFLDKSDEEVTLPQKTTYTFVNPTKKLARIEGAKGPFYLTMNESYHPKWRLILNNAKAGWLPWARPHTITASNHIKWNNFLNGWYVDPAELCKNGDAGCIKNRDGSYDIEIIVEFAPQRWFYFGVVVSVLTLVGCIGYLGSTAIRDKNIRHRWTVE